MAGIVGIVGGNVSAQQKTTALARLCHAATFTEKWLFESAGVSLGAAFRRAAPPSTFSDTEAGLVVLTYGTPLSKRGGWHVVRPSEIAAKYLEQGKEALFCLDGSFVAVVLDLRAHKLVVVNDRLGSIPVQFAADSGRFAFAPEAKALFPLLAVQPRLSADGLIGFLAGGYPIGDRTVFESVHMLEPAHCLEVETTGARYSVMRYWDLTFPVATRVGPREAAEQLYELLLDAHKACLVDQPERVQLLLTGGYDSRTILGGLGAIGRRPDEAVSWGISEAIPGSDPELAGRLAREYDVPFRVLTYGAGSVPEEGEEWSYVSELTSDNMGNYAAGTRFLCDGSEPAPLVWIGDQMLGPHGLPRDVTGAAESITNVPAESLPAALQRLLRSDRRCDAARTYHEQIKRVIARSRSDSPKDVQDYLFFHLYVFRWLLAPSYFREPMVSARRPLLLNDIVDFAATLPPWLRVDKRVLIHMLHLKMPNLMKYPKNSADSLVDWSFELRRHEALRGLTSGLLRYERLRATPIGDLIDEKALEAFVTRFFAEAPEPRSRQRSLATRVFAVRRRLSRTAALSRISMKVEPLVKRLLGMGRGDQAVPVVLRLAQVALLQQCIERGWFDASSGRPSFETSS